MKKKIFITMLAFAILGSVNVFAEDTQELSVSKTITDLPSKLPALEMAEDNNMESQYKIMSGKIESIKQEKDYYSISVTNEDMGVVFTADKNAFIVNSKDGSFMTFDELQNDMEIAGIIVKNAPMTLSLPPMTNAVGFVVGTENFAATGYFDEEWTSQEIMLQLNISEKTKIVNKVGTKQIFVADDVKNQDCLVIYGPTTRSIPAQTAPIFVMIMGEEGNEIALEPVLVEPEITLKPGIEEPVLVGPEITLEPEIEKPEPVVELVPLRETAENKGFTVTWNGNDKPVILQKGELTIEVTLGKAEYIKDGDEVYQSEKTAELIQSKIYVGSDVIQ